MSKLTPIQEAIKWHKSEKYKVAGNLQQRRFNETTDSTIEFLESLLPTEKQFAKDVWEAGKDTVYGTEVGESFNTFYKQYES